MARQKKEKPIASNVILEDEMMVYPFLPCFGFQQTSLVDYPGEVATVIFLCGCTFRCQYCHNRKNIEIRNAMDIKEYEKMLEDIITSKTTAVVISGGEPTMWPESLYALCQWFRHFVPNKKIKLDTNGSNSAIVKRLIDDNLVNFVAMDIKTTLNDDMYRKHFCSQREELEVVLTAQLLMNSELPHMFRHTEDASDTPEIIASLKDTFKDIVIQKQVIRDMEE